MINLTEKEVNAEIAIREVNPLDCAKLQELANLYIVRDHMGATSPRSYDAGYSMETAPMLPPPDTAGEYGRSDFLRAIAGKDLKKLWIIMDELMDSFQAVNQKVYISTMRKIESL